MSGAHSLRSMHGVFVPSDDIDRGQGGDDDILEYW